ncbi:uncharacterized protein LOC144135062 [Amblyomma americanum]
MAEVAEVLEVVSKSRRIFEVSFDEYVGTVNGLFNFIELCGGWALYFMLGTAETSMQRLLGGTAYTYSFNGLFMIITSFLSYTSAHILPTTFYYVMFHGTAALLYICTCIMIVRDSKEVGGPPTLGLMTGGVHSFHCAYATYKNYYEK